MKLRGKERGWFRNRAPESLGKGILKIILMLLRIPMSFTYWYSPRLGEE